MNFRNVSAIKNCEYCNTEFTSSHSNIKLCDEHKNDKTLCKCGICKQIKQKYTSLRTSPFGYCCEECFNSVIVKETHITLNDINQDEWVECKICGYRTGELSLHIKNIHKMTSEKYKDSYPNSKLKCKKTCDRMKGENNPAYQHGGKFSPFSDKSICHSKEDMIEIRERAKANTLKNINSSSGSTQISNYLALGMSEDDAKKALSERQKTFSLDICVKKHGIEEGTRIWQERQDGWQNTLNAKSQEEKDRINKAKMNSSGSISKNETELFESLSHHFPVESQYVIRVSSRKSFIYDIRCGNKLIEYNGDYWHANPLTYKFDEEINYRGTYKLAEDVWSKDKDKSDHAHGNGYEIMIIWEKDYIKDKRSALDKCIKFLS